MHFPILFGQSPASSPIASQPHRSIGAAVYYSLLLAMMPSLPASAETKPIDATLEFQTLEDFHFASESVARKPVTDADASYRAKLEKHQKSAQAAGNLKSLQAARQAIADLDAGRPPLVSDDPEVAAIQKIYMSQRQKADAESEKALAKADQDHLAALKKLVVELTKAGHFDQAQEVQAKVDGLSVILNPKATPSQTAAGGQEIEIWKKKAQTEFPALNDPTSPLSKRVQILREQKKSMPNYFNNPQWPYLLAKEAEQRTSAEHARYEIIPRQEIGKLHAGSRMFSNRNYEWGVVPEKILGWEFTRYNIRQKIQISIKSKGLVHICSKLKTEDQRIILIKKCAESGWLQSDLGEICEPDAPKKWLIFKKVLDTGLHDIPVWDHDVGTIVLRPDLEKMLSGASGNNTEVSAVEETKTESPPKTRGIVTGRANQLSQAQGGKSKVMADMEFILSKYGTAENDVAAHPDVTIYEGPSPGGVGGNCRITYLMPRAEAEAQLFKNRGIVNRKTAVAPGFPPEMVIYTYDIRFGIYNRLYLMVDLADQVVTMQLKSENTIWIPDDRRWAKMERDFSTFDYINTETRGTPTMFIDTRVLRMKSYIVVNMVAVMIKETTTWYVPEPLTKQILFHLAEDKRRSGKK